MTATFAELVEEVRRRTPEEQEALAEVLAREMIVARRREIAAGSRESAAREAAGELEFFSDREALLKSLHGA